jgi:DNA transformation protein and related proteins
MAQLDLKGLGPKSQAILAQAGITQLEQLQEMGSIPAYACAKKTCPNVSLNLLWALESVLTGIHWQDIARHHRTSLLLALESYLQTNPFQAEENDAQGAQTKQVGPPPCPRKSD